MPVYLLSTRLTSILTNCGTLNGGSVSGNSLNRGTFNQVEIVPDTILDNTGGTISGGVNNGNVFGGTVSGEIDNKGILSGTAPDGTRDPDYELVIETGAVIKGGTMGGAALSTRVLLKMLLLMRMLQST